MLQIVSITPTVEPFEDGVLATYEIIVESRGVRNSYWAEARESEHTEAQIDWSDDLSGLLYQLDAPESSHSQISLAVFQAFIGEPLDYPISLGQKT